MRNLASTLLPILAALAGCAPAANSPRTQPDIASSDVAPPEADSQLSTELDQVLAETRTRRLSLGEHGGWQLLHGALAFGPEFLAEDAAGQRIPLLAHLRGGGAMKGWDFEPGAAFADGRTGLRAILFPGSKVGQGHVDQWLAIITQCGLTIHDELTIDGRVYTMQDWVRQAQQDVPRNVDREYPWTLVGLTQYLPTDARWTASDGEEWSIERLVAAELEQELVDGACGGTHRLIALAMTLQRHRERGGELTGVWAEADEYLQSAIDNARRWQNEDGSFSVHYFERPGTSADLPQNIGATGHVVELLSLALPDDQLGEPWVERAVWYLCGALRATRDFALECGALYHAAHGLVIYQQRRFAADPPDA